MRREVLVVNPVKNEAVGIGDILLQAGYTPRIIDGIEGVDAAMRSGDCMAVMVDLDSLELSNRTVRQVTLEFPDVGFLCTSWKPFHPELQDAICHHMYACVLKPIDPDELLFWLKSIAAQADGGHPP
jgi:DNA-binding NtrC family response regulator